MSPESKNKDLIKKLILDPNEKKKIKFAIKAAGAAIMIADVITDGKVAQEFDKVQDKIDEKIAPKGEEFIEKLENVIDEKIGNKIEKVIDDVDNTLGKITSHPEILKKTKEMEPLLGEIAKPINKIYEKVEPALTQITKNGISKIVELKEKSQQKKKEKPEEKIEKILKQTMENTKKITKDMERIIKEGSEKIKENTEKTLEKLKKTLKFPEKNQKKDNEENDENENPTS